MSGIFRVLDTRVGASLEDPAPQDMVVNAKTDTAVALATLADLAYPSKINRLLLICHSEHTPDQSRWKLLLGAPGIGHDNVSVVDPLKGKFSGEAPRVELRGCWIATNIVGGPAAIVPSATSGAALCHAIADRLGVDVWGSDAEQPGPCGNFQPMEIDMRESQPDGGVNVARKQVPTHRECSEGRWNGRVYIYRPGKSGAVLYNGTR